MGIAARDSFDWPGYFVTGAFALLYQAENQNPDFGKGLPGYAKRYGAAYGDQVIGNFLEEGIFPTLFHEDPRYFRRGDGSTLSRIGTSLGQIVIGRRDSGRWNVNLSELLGGVTAAGIANAYYPDSRTLPANLQRFGMQIGTDALSNVLKEFWPDIKHKLFKHQDSQQGPPKSPYMSTAH